jgi:CheY-like chemotaxis protein
MGLSEKVDLLDLIIHTLREHEEKLDSLIFRLEVLYLAIQQNPDFLSALLRGAAREKRPEEEEGSSVLLVDDDEDLVDTLKMILKAGGYKVDTANSGEQALTKARKKRFKLAIVDMKLPDIMGSELAKVLKGLNEDTDIVLITGYSSFIDGQEALDLDVQDILVKPIKAKDLLKATAKSLGKL